MSEKKIMFLFKPALDVKEAKKQEQKNIKRWNRSSKKLSRLTQKELNLATTKGIKEKNLQQRLESEAKIFDKGFLSNYQKIVDINNQDFANNIKNFTSAVTDFTIAVNKLKSIQGESKAFDLLNRAKEGVKTSLEMGRKNNNRFGK